MYPAHIQKTYYAHISEDNRKQTVNDHLCGVAEQSARFAKAFDAEEHGKRVGLAHDIGKCSDAFQRRLAGGPKVDHSIAGAVLCAMHDESLTAACVAGHHSGLPDFGNAKTDMAGDATLIGRIKKYLLQSETIPEEWEAIHPDTAPEPDFHKNGFYRSLWGRMLYSCLVDADFLDTESFMRGSPAPRSGYEPLPVLLDKLNNYIRQWDPPKNALNTIRNTVLQKCIQAGKQKKGLYSLTVPTGGGKTVSSVAFALHHAIEHKMERIIYVIPYTSIIEQNADVFRKIFGDHNVVEHHSESQLNNAEDLEEDKKHLALATENWDAPIIVTTSVQFFESLYANRSSKCRKLHNIANSVIIFDEAQMLPIQHLLPCAAVIGTLVAHFNASAVLCTATQPFIADLLARFAPDIPVREICDNTGELVAKLKRTTYKQIGQISVESLAEKLTSHAQVLCIVNKRATAQTLFDLLPEEGSFHLSTLMYPQHRQRTLEEIRRRLQAGAPCRVVSTSLIEAGVDVDFPAVYRELAGLDSVIQAAGRCNREGKRPVEESIVTVFELDAPASPMFRVNIGAAKEALSESIEISSPETANRYFTALRSYFNNGIDKTNAVKYLSEGKAGCDLPYRQVAEDFHLIDSNTGTVYIICKESEEDITAIREGRADKNTYRRAGKYSVEVYDDHYRKLLSAGDIVELTPGSAYLVNQKQYHEKTGLSLSVETGIAVFS